MTNPLAEFYIIEDCSMRVVRSSFPVPVRFRENLYVKTDIEDITIGPIRVTSTNAVPDKSSRMITLPRGTRQNFHKFDETRLESSNCLVPIKISCGVRFTPTSGHIRARLVGNPRCETSQFVKFSLEIPNLSFKDCQIQSIQFKPEENAEWIKESSSIIWRLPAIDPGVVYIFDANFQYQGERQSTNETLLLPSIVRFEIPNFTFSNITLSSEKVNVTSINKRSRVELKSECKYIYIY